MMAEPAKEVSTALAQLKKQPVAAVLLNERIHKGFLMHCGFRMNGHGMALTNESSSHG
jgi:hypothetical protein